MRTVDVKPLEETTESGVNVETNTGDIDEPRVTPKPPSREGANDDDDDRVTVEDTGDIDVIRAGSPELFDVANEIPVGNIEQFEVKK